MQTCWTWECNDRLYAGGGNDTLLGGAGADWLSGDDGNDLLKGASSTEVDAIRCWARRRDTLYGGLARFPEWCTDADVLWGEADNDTLDGGTAPTPLYGGTGNDVYAVDTASIGSWKIRRGTDRVESTSDNYWSAFNDFDRCPW